MPHEGCKRRTRVGMVQTELRATVIVGKSSYIVYSGKVCLLPQPLYYCIRLAIDTPYGRNNPQLIAYTNLAV